MKFSTATSKSASVRFWFRSQSVNTAVYSSSALAPPACLTVGWGARSERGAVAGERCGCLRHQLNPT